MAIAWVCRNRNETDPVTATFFIARQAIAERLAQKWNLKVSYHIGNHFIDLAVQGELAQIADFLEDLADLYGIGGLTIDLEDGDDDCQDNIEEVEAGAYNIVVDV